MAPALPILLRLTVPYIGSMAIRSAAKAIEAVKALKAMQEDANRKGLDQMSMDEINREIAAYRREKRIKSPPVRGAR